MPDPGRVRGRVHQWVTLPKTLLSNIEARAAARPIAGRPRPALSRAAREFAYRGRRQRSLGPAAGGHRCRSPLSRGGLGCTRTTPAPTVATGTPIPRPLEAG